MSKKTLVIFIPSIESGGVEKNLFIISNYLANHLITKVVLITSEVEIIKNLFNKKIIIVSPLKIFKTNSRKIKFYLSLLLLLLYYVRNKNFVVLSFQANIYAILICKIIGIKILARSNSSPVGWSSNLIKKFIFRFLLNLADRVIVNSLDFKKIIDKEFHLNSTCIFNPFDKIFCKKQSKKKININFFKNSKKVLKIINVGRLTDQKDHLTLLKAIMIIKDEIPLKLLIIGQGINKNLLENFVTNNKLASKVKLIGYRKNSLNFINKSDLFILSSRYEGLPNVLLEAVCLKKFVISSDCSTGPREILSNGKGGLLFKVGDEYDLANKILYFYHNKDKLKKKRFYAYQKLSRYNYKNNLRKYLSLINKFI
jgi:glycosyltransferase involved in cell wall biosynthesis